MNGVLLIDKPAGMRSRQVVDAVGKRFRVRKIGHAGTLDPIATGLLVLLLGEGTKLSAYLMEGRKRYRATLTLGVETDTYDSEGAEVARTDVAGLDPRDVYTVLNRFRGTLQQMPPEYAAIKVDGKPLYKYARQGESVTVAPREVTIYSLDVLDVALPHVEVDVACSKGTYMRSIAHDVGRALGVGGHLSAIRRIESVPFHVREALPLDEVEAMPPDALEAALIPPERALAHVPQVTGGPELDAHLENGRPIPGELLYGQLPTELQPGALVQVCGTRRLAVMELTTSPSALGPPPWTGTRPLKYKRILHLASAA